MAKKTPNDKSTELVADQISELVEEKTAESTIVPVDLEVEEAAEEKAFALAPEGGMPAVPEEEEDPEMARRRLRARLLAQLAELDAEGEKGPDMMPADMAPGEEEEDPEERKRRLRAQILAQLAEIGGEDEEEKQPMGVPPAPVSAMPPEEEEVDPDEERKRRRAALLAQLAELDAEEGKMTEIDGDMRFRLEQLRGPLPGSSEKMVEIDGDMRFRIQELRAKRLGNIGIKQEEIAGLAENGFMCAVSRKVMPEGTAPCEFCRGGCTREGGLPGLLDIEAIAEDQYKGVVVNSGYASADNVFLVDIKCEDGELIEAIYTGEGKPAGWVLLDAAALDETSEKSLQQERKVVSMEEAQDIATKAIDGTALGVTAAIFEGYDVYAIEVEGVNGKSYDAYVALDGTLLGWDEYPLNVTEMDELASKAMVAELELKRAYPRNMRMQFAAEGLALPDGSFPIADEDDLANAILAVDRAVSPPLAKAHTMKRAVELGLEDLIPDLWLQEAEEEKSEESADVEEKRFVSSEDRESFSKRGWALPDGSFPIANETDLRAAIHAVGRAKDIDKAKAHIRKRARELGLESLLGEGFDARKKDDEMLASLMEFELLAEELGIEDGKQ